MPDGTIAMDPQGTLWYRGLARKNEAKIENLLNTIFKTHDANRLVVGHTVSKKGIKLRANGKVIMIDVGMSKYYAGTAGCLLIVNGKYFAVYPEAVVELAVYNN